MLQVLGRWRQKIRSQEFKANFSHKFLTSLSYMRLFFFLNLLWEVPSQCLGQKNVSSHLDHQSLSTCSMVALNFPLPPQCSAHPPALTPSSLPPFLLDSELLKGRDVLVRSWSLKKNLFSRNLAFCVPPHPVSSLISMPSPLESHRFRGETTGLKGHEA